MIMKKTTLLATVGAAAFLSVACGTPKAAEKPADGAAPAAADGTKAPEGSCGGEKKAGEGSCGGAKTTEEAPKN